VLYGTKAFLPSLLAQREGWIVNISSVFGLIGYSAQGAYNMSKFAVRGLTECLWSELDGTGVQAVCVHPGGIATNIEKASRRVALADQVEERLIKVTDTMLVTTPEECAADILRGLHAGKRRIMTGHRAGAIYWIARLFPNTYPRLLKLLIS
jgi:short-subunit dehydrogenase